LWTVNQDPPTEPILSPDGQHLLLVTQRGVLETNKIESSIWMFDRQAVEDFVGKRSAHKPLPKEIVNFAATSNTPVISDIRWLDDSTQVAFLARTTDGTSQLFITDSLTGAVQQVTHASQSVSAYDIHGQTIA